jgi:GNAT superfamily N-acetyltransferase
MRKLIYSMQVSLDGFIAGPDGEIAVPAPDEELHRFHNEQTRELGAHLCGRRLYEVMSYWDTAADTVLLTIEVEGAVAGLIQIAEELDPIYRHENPSLPDDQLEFAQIWKDLAGIDLFLDPALHGRGFGTEAVRRAVCHVIDERGHHRVTIDPAASNTVAIRAYKKVGFRAVGVMRGYERDADGGGWHDGLLMELLAGEEVRV